MSVGVVNKSTGDRIPTAGDPLDKVGNLANLTTTAKTNAVAAINEVNAGLATKADLTDLAPAFSTATAYTVGKYVSYEGNIYKCTSAHSAGAWVAGDFTLVAVGSELESKQDKTDNNLQTTDKTVVGAINEHEGDIGSLMSGLTNVDVALSVPENTGKNVLPLTLDSLKEINSNGTWAVNVYTKNSMTFTVSTNTNGYVTAIVVNGTADVEEDTTFNLIRITNLNNMLYGAYILNGCPSGGDPNYQIYIGSDVKDKGNGVSFNTPLTGTYSGIRVKSDYTASNLTFHPMIRLASVSDPTFAPYIPSVESRIEAVESGLDDVETRIGALQVYKKWANSITVTGGMNTIVMFAAMSGQSNMFTYNSYSDVLTPIGNSSGVTATKDASTDTVTFSATIGGSFAVYVL